MKYIKNVFFATVAIMTIVACSEDVERVDYISFEGYTAELAAPIPSSGSIDVKVYTTGTSGTFDLVVDADASTADPANFTVPSTVTVSDGNMGVFTVEATPGLADTEIVLKLKSNGSTIVGPPITINVVGLCDNPNLLIEFLFDDYAEETSWAITDPDGNILKSVAEGDYAGLTDITEGHCFPSGNYTFTVYDSFGDGLSWPNLGYVIVSLSDGTELGRADGDFGASATFDFTVP